MMNAAIAMIGMRISQKPIVVHMAGGYPDRVIVSVFDELSSTSALFVVLISLSQYVPL